MPYEMFITIQLKHLTCGKDRAQSPTRKEGCDLFRRTSVDSSVRIYNPINIHEYESESLRVRDTMEEERASEEYKNHMT